MYVRAIERLGQVPTSGDWLSERLGKPPIGTNAPRIGSQFYKDGTALRIGRPAPRLLDKRDNTLYVEISLGIDEAENGDKKKFKVNPVTGIFIPNGYDPRTDLNLILYLHGHTNTYPGDGVPIEGYWDAKKHPFFALREGVNDSGKNVILVAPTLGPLSQAGGLTYWPDTYLDQVLLALMAHGPHKHDLFTANIILACHSGGGAIMRRIAVRNHRFTANIRECWGFDCLYGGKSETDEWIAWGQSNRSLPTRNLYIYYCDYVDPKDSKKNCLSTKVNSVSLKRNSGRPSNVTVERSTARNHFWVPLAHWTERIKNTAFLPNR